MSIKSVTGPDGKKYKLVVLKVTGKDEHGRPSTCVVGYDDTSFHLEGGEEFITAFVPAETIEKKS